MTLNFFGLEKRGGGRITGRKASISLCLLKYLLMFQIFQQFTCIFPQRLHIIINNLRLEFENIVWNIVKKNYYSKNSIESALKYFDRFISITGNRKADKDDDKEANEECIHFFGKEASKNISWETTRDHDQGELTNEKVF